jgi:hypothetical protein
MNMDISSVAKGGGDDRMKLLLTLPNSPTDAPLTGVRFFPG